MSNSFAQNQITNTLTAYAQHQSFPKAKHHRDGRQLIVRNPEEEERVAIGPHWKDTPWTEADLAAQVAGEPAPAPDCPNCAAMREKFDEAWSKLSDEHDKLLADHQALQEQHNTVLALLADGPDASAEQPSTEAPGTKNTKKKA